MHAKQGTTTMAVEIPAGPMLNVTAVAIIGDIGPLTTDFYSFHKIYPKFIRCKLRRVLWKSRWVIERVLWLRTFFFFIYLVRFSFLSFVLPDIGISISHSTPISTWDRWARCFSYWSINFILELCYHRIDSFFCLTNPTESLLSRTGCTMVKYFESEQVPYRWIHPWVSNHTTHIRLAGLFIPCAKLSAHLKNAS